ncbi:MAG: hypothetical protein JNN01_10990 [Opitutaceae bacterium]|nr:hypothetical protein [Opitutaceae bacterium]
MFANLLHLITGSSPASPEYNRAFVQDVAVQSVEPRSRRVERALILGWVLIIMKCVLIAWAISHYRIPIHATWIVAPTLAMAAICTVIYVRRR